MIEEVLAFWFEDLEPMDWFRSSDELDDKIREKFGALREQATKCELYGWRATAQGRLAEIIVLDQFSRNLRRNSPDAFAADPLALALAQETVALGMDKSLSPIERSFLYMPYMHSESLTIHEIGLKLFEDNGLQGNIDAELQHKVIIERFGRYPHRNEVLGRESSEDEIAFLKEPNSSF